MDKMKGKLYLVATPIGNMEDITIRALHVLGSAHVIAAEDTRRTLKLLQRYDIKKRLVSFHEFNKSKVGPELIERILRGEDIALVSDAGSPGISDPGFSLVRLAIGKGIDVVSIPGASSVITALQISGLPTHAFTFEGFLPKKKGKRRAKLESLKDEERTMVFFESPHRVRATISELLEILGDRNVAICRELTKLFEEVRRTTLAKAQETLEKETVKGEIVLVVEGTGKARSRDIERHPRRAAPKVNQQTRSRGRDLKVGRDSVPDNEPELEPKDMSQDTVENESVDEQEGHGT